MLRTLTIANYALIDSLSVEFPNGLTILTGETGAGKSIILGALGLIIGERADAAVVRSGADHAVVEGTFEVSGNAPLRSFFEEHELEWREECIVRREVSAKGTSRCFVNDSPVTVAIQKRIGEFLIDLHGQHEHQSLLRTETHILMLDDFGGLDGMVSEFQEEYRRLKEATAGLESLRTRERQLRERLEFMRFQLQEIDAVSPTSGEEDALAAELLILENAEKLYGATARLHEQLYEGEQSVHDLLVVARNTLHDLSEIDRQFAGAAAECSSAEAIVKELAKFIQGYNARIEFAPDRLEELRDRLGKIALLKKKYGGSLDAVLAHRETVAHEVELAENFEGIRGGMERDVERARAACGAIAQRLSAKRHETARRVDRAVVAELQKLGIANAHFTTRINTAGATDGRLSVLAGGSPLGIHSRGYDLVEFTLSTNLGEEERPLAKIASGGEISRVMLALKSILAKADRLPVLVFDEIDVGVSGRIAQAVGKSLKSLSGFHQVVAITHLPQIAGVADAHFVVEKREGKKRTTSSIRRLNLEEQVEEIARLMSGEEVTAAGKAGARELMGLSESAHKRKTHGTDGL